jgi:arginine-tRNA-protein transferase
VLTLQKFIQGPSSCAYLPQLASTTEYELVARLSPEEYERRMNEGWRKFGALLFRPVCSACAACRPVRVPVNRFAPSRSQKRALRDNADLRIELNRPVLDDVRLSLFNGYHAAQAVAKGWPAEPVSAKEYHFQFVRNPLETIELSVWAGDRLVAVVINDVTPTVLSAVYHYYEPELPGRGLGTFAILQTIELARRLAKPYLYLGYFVAGSPSMAYKTKYRPLELMDADGVWRVL